MARILIIGINYAPEATGIAPYTTGLAEHLAASGHDVRVATGMPHYPAWRIDDAYGARRAAPGVEEQRRGVTVQRHRHYVPRTPTALRRAAYEASFVATGLSALRDTPPDAVIGVTPGLGGAVLARFAGTRFKAPYGLIVQDVASSAVEQAGAQARGFVAMPVRAVEGWAARGAAAVGVIAEGFRPRLQAMGVEPGRIHRVRNWTHTREAAVDSRTARAWLDLPSDRAIVLHAGNMGQKQGLEHVLACARLAADEAPELLFVLSGDGSQRPALEAIAARDALDNVRFLPLQPESLFPSMLGAADVLLINQRATVTDMSLPSKLTSYFASGRPVVAAAAAGSETAREIIDSGAGLIVAPEQPRALLDALRRVAGDPGLSAHLGAQGKRWAAGVLSKDAAMRGYDDLLAAVLADGAATPASSQQRAATEHDTASSDERRAA